MHTCLPACREVTTTNTTASLHTFLLRAAHRPARITPPIPYSLLSLSLSLSLSLPALLAASPLRFSRPASYGLLGIAIFRRNNASGRFQSTFRCRLRCAHDGWRRQGGSLSLVSVARRGPEEDQKTTRRRPEDDQKTTRRRPEDDCGGVAMDGDGRCGVGGVVYGCGSGVVCERDVCECGGCRCGGV